MPELSPLPTGSAAESELHDRRLEAELRRHFGFESFRRGQRPVIEALLAGRSAAAVFPTGGGKSLCYQLPALLLDGLTVVVSPLLALMKDQVDALVARGLPAARLDSSLTADEVRAVRERLRAGSLRLLYVSPERFANERFRSLLEHLSVALFAVDEAHCISEWGHNFRPDYLKLPRTARALGAERVLALTATATPDVLEDICRSFEIAPGDAVRTGVYRPNLSLRTTPVARGARDAALLEHVAQRPPGAGIVYVTLQKTAERVADLLRAARHEAMAYHAGLDAETRSRIQDEFLASDRALVVATIAFGMGIDKPNIRSVDHYDLPKSLENWSQEIGRAGRDGEPAICRVFGSIDDLVTLSNFAYGDTPSREAVRSLLDEVLSRNAEQALALVSLSRRVDIRPLVLRTLLTYLELDGVLEIGTPRYATYRFRPLASSAEILARFDGARRELLRGIFRRARKARTWFDLDLETVASELDQPRERIVGALDHLAERQLFELRATDLRQIVRRRGPVDDLEWLADSLHERLLEREARELERLGRVVELIEHDGCQMAALCAAFGETLDAPCGRCSVCLGERVELPAPDPPEVDLEALERALALRVKHPETLGNPRATARFLAGLTSPRLGAARLGRHPLYGVAAGVPFDELLRLVEDASGS